MEKHPSNILWKDEGMNYYSKHVDTQIDKILTKYIDLAFGKYTSNYVYINRSIFLYPPEASGGYFGLASATPPPRVERFSALTL